MKIVQQLPGLTQFVAKKGDHGIENDIAIDVIPLIPFEVPDELGGARIKASPNLYRAATEKDDEYTKNYVAEQKKKLEAIAPNTTPPAEPEGPDEFNAADYLLSNEQHTAESLGELKAAELKLVADELELKYKGNVSKTELIELILAELNK